MKLDFIKIIKSVTFSGADINSDHNPVDLEFKMRRFKTVKGEKQSKRTDTEKLKDPLVPMQLGSENEYQINNLEAFKRHNRRRKDY